MATCPRCKGPLTDNHRCPRRPSIVAAELVASGLAGGLVAWLLLIAFDRFNQLADMDAITIIVGASVGVGLNRLVRG